MAVRLVVDAGAMEAVVAVARAVVAGTVKVTGMARVKGPVLVTEQVQGTALVRAMVQTALRLDADAEAVSAGVVDVDLVTARAPDLVTARAPDLVTARAPDMVAGPTAVAVVVVVHVFTSLRRMPWWKTLRTEHASS